MNSQKKIRSNTIETDIIIAGAGGAGLAAAVSAAEAGAKVIVLEKQNSPGGNSSLAGGLFGAESRFQKQFMVHANKDELFKAAMDYAHWQINPDIVRAFIDKSADTIQWLEDMGLEFEMLFAVYPNQSPLTWHLPQGAGAGVIEILAKRCENLGVNVLKKTAGKKILTDSSGKITGVSAASKDQEFDIRSKAVILATGGYGGSKKLLKKYFSKYTPDMHCLGAPCKGDGILMALEAGAATEGLGTLLLHGPYFPKSPHIDVLARQPYTLWVNSNGKRFADEELTFRHSECGNALARQPGNISFSLFDSKVVEKIKRNGTITIHIHVMPQTKLTDIDKKLEKEVVKGTLKISESWADIAEWMGIDSKVLQSTVEEYNKACDNGYDSLFVKDKRWLNALKTPPYYSVKNYASFLGTIGGIKINHHMKAIGQEGEPIPGLYVVGNDAGGWEPDTYNYRLAGSAFGFAVNSGRIAGENATRT